MLLAIFAFVFGSLLVAAAAKALSPRSFAGNGGA